MGVQHQSFWEFINKIVNLKHVPNSPTKKTKEIC